MESQDIEKTAGTLQIVERDGIQSVSARELFEGLESNERFSKWWDRFASYGFVEDTDFVVCTKKYVANQYGGEKEFTDYAITIDMAKQICMLQRSEKGRQYRQYLINLEKAWNSPEKVMERALSIAHQRAEEATRRIMEMQPKALVYDRIADGRGCYSMNQTAKALKLPYGNIKLFERLRADGILNADNSPRQEQVDAGRFRVVVKFINERVGSRPVTLTTGKGLVYLAKRFNADIDESVKADM